MNLRFVLPALVAPALVIGANQIASAQTQGGIKLEVRLPGDGSYVLPENDETLVETFNLARCQCAQAYQGTNPPTEVVPSYFAIQLEVNNINAGTLVGQRAEIWVGDNCNTTNLMERNERCTKVDELSDLSVLSRPQVIPVSFAEFMFPPSGSCQERQETSTVYVLIDTNSDSSTFEEEITAQISFDSQPPPLPAADSIKADPAESAVVLSWTNPDANDEDIKYYQVLCREQGTSTPLFSNAAEDAFYEVKEALCPDSGGVNDMVDAGVPDAGAEPDAAMNVVDAGPEMGYRRPPGGVHTATYEEYDPRFLCGTTTGTSTSIRINGLKNAVTYEFTLLAVDDSRNFQALYAGEAMPTAAVDFWEDYQESGGGAEGGICLVTSTFGNSSGLTQALRDFRDSTLARWSAGRWLTDVYYAYIAPLGVYAERNMAVRIVAAVVLAPVAVMAGIWEYGGVLGMLALLVPMGMWLRWRRRRGRAHGAHQEHETRSWRLGRGVRWSLVSGAVLAVALLPGLARAQAADPYWDEYQPVGESASELAPVPHWNAALRLGPYMPAVDSEFMVAEGEAGPYEQMFGGSGLMFGFDLDRYFLFPAGQLGLTASAGYMSKTASAYAAYNCTEDDAPSGCVPGRTVIRDASGEPVRAEGDNTGFRLVPMSLGVVYRLTVIDDALGIPVVPYGKAGLSYYLWWITNPNGGIAEVGTEMCPDPSDETMGCDGNRALGASLGFQFTVGLAVRAERLDTNAAYSLRNELGIEHAGFFAELAYAKVDGFGSDTKLAVGDLTWSAGLNFEF